MESAACPITKASNSHFHIPLLFSFSTFPVSIREFFSLFDTRLSLTNFNKMRSAASSHYTARATTCLTCTCFVCSTKLNPVRRG